MGTYLEFFSHPRPKKHELRASYLVKASFTELKLPPTSPCEPTETTARAHQPSPFLFFGYYKSRMPQKTKGQPSHH